MIRGGQIATGAAFHDLANQSFSAQGSLSYGWYDTRSLQALLEVELGATFDSGIFNGNTGGSLNERFWTLAVRGHPLSFETWNDQLNSKDFGPTFGARIMIDLLFLLPDSWKVQ